MITAPKVPNLQAENFSIGDRREAVLKDNRRNKKVDQFAKELEELAKSANAEFVKVEQAKQATADDREKVAADKKTVAEDRSKVAADKKTVAEDKSSVDGMRSDVASNASQVEASKKVTEDHAKAARSSADKAAGSEYSSAQSAANSKASKEAAEALYGDLSAVNKAKTESITAASKAETESGKASAARSGAESANAEVQLAKTAALEASESAGSSAAKAIAEATKSEEAKAVALTASQSASGDRSGAQAAAQTATSERGKAEAAASNAAQARGKAEAAATTAGQERGKAETARNGAEEALAQALQAAADANVDVDNAIADLVDSSPDALNTLNELAQALGNDPNFATTMTKAVADKVAKSQLAATMSDHSQSGDHDGRYILKSGHVTWEGDKVSGLSIYDTRDFPDGDEVPTPLLSPDRTISSVFSTKLVGNSYRSAMIVKGWNIDYSAWMMSGPAGFSADDDFYLQSGKGAAWRDAVLVYHSGNQLSLGTSAASGRSALGLGSAATMGTTGSRTSSSTSTLLQAAAMNAHRTSGDHDTRYLQQTGGTLSGQVEAEGTAGLYGKYDPTKINHIWSIAPQYKVAEDGSNFGSLYGLAYAYVDHPSAQGLAGLHQLVLCHNGAPRVALGSNGTVWALNGFKGPGSQITDLDASALKSGNIPAARIVSTASRNNAGAGVMLEASAMRDHNTSGDHDGRYVLKGQVQNDLYDTTSDKLLKVGAFGLGATVIYNSDFSPKPSGFYRTYSGDPDSPTGNAGNWIEASRDENSGFRLFSNTNSDALYYQRIAGGDSLDWLKIYHTGNLDPLEQGHKSSGDHDNRYGRLGASNEWAGAQVFKGFIHQLTSNGAYIRENARNEGETTRQHTYSVDVNGSTSAYLQAWYGGNSYTNVTTTNDGVEFDKFLTAPALFLHSGVSVGASTKGVHHNTSHGYVTIGNRTTEGTHYQSSGGKHYFYGTLACQSGFSGNGSGLTGVDAAKLDGKSLGDMEVVTGSNSNGRYFKYPDGRLVMHCGIVSFARDPATNRYTLASITLPFTPLSSADHYVTANPSSDASSYGTGQSPFDVGTVLVKPGRMSSGTVVEVRVLAAYGRSFGGTQTLSMPVMIESRWK